MCTPATEISAAAMRGLRTLMGLPGTLLSAALRQASMACLLLVATTSSAWAIPLLCLNEGTRSATAAYTVPGTIPADFGVSGPKDLDPGADDNVDACKTFYFNVPAVNYEGKSAPGGWGGLVLTFDRALDGASFIFDPNCAIPIQGDVQDPNATEATTFRFKNRAYGFLPTDSATKNGGIFSPLVVTVMYDSTGPNDDGPKLLYGPDNAPLSFWQGKPGKQGFGFAGEDGFLPVRVPEPSTLLLMALGLMCLAFPRRCP